MDSAALLVIDLQNEFLTEQGLFASRHIHLSTILPALTRAVERLRAASPQPVIWVRSEYDHKAPRAVKRLSIPPEKAKLGVPGNDDFLSSSHFGRRPCCPAGSVNAQFHEDIATLIRGDDWVITKRWYSSFTDTDLHASLQSAGVTRLYVAGVVSQVCVLATICDAFFLGYQVTALEDCIAATSPERHDFAMNKIQEHYGEIGRSEEL